MPREIVINATKHESRIAVLDEGQVVELWVERTRHRTIVGNIYNGRVTRVLPGMQSAFVDLGLERDAFLYVTDFLELEDQEESDELEKAAAAGGNQPPREVRQGNVQRQEARPELRSDRQERPDRQDRPGRGDRERRPSAPETAAQPPQPEQPSPEIPALTGHVESDSEQAGDGGAKRWRGRRRRRGGRGAPTHVSD